MQIVTSGSEWCGLCWIDDKTLYAFDAQLGSKLWSKQLGDMVTSSPFVLDGVVYVGCEDSQFYAFHLPG